MSRKSLPFSMMAMLRGRLGLEANDTSRDEDILEMTPDQIVRECAAWKLGDEYWAVIIAGWMKAAGCKIEDLC